MESHKTFADIDLNALTNNLNVVRTKAGSKDILAVVKANAYGHGAVKISRHLIREGVSFLGVAFTSEAIALRLSDIDVPILIFFDRDNAEACIDYKLTPVVSDLTSATKISNHARKFKSTIPVHVKIDTGMGRVGLNINEAKETIIRIASLENIKLQGIMSHFSDADLEDKHFANHQLKSFQGLVMDLGQKNITFEYIHMANSAAVLTVPNAHFNLVRPGIMLYGYACCESEKLKPVMKVKSSIILLKSVPAGTPISYARTFVTKRTSTIATVPIGYADGYNRRLSSTGEVLVNGKLAPVVGRVCMDTIMVDVTEIPDVDYNSEVVLMGQQGNEQITADDIAEKTGTISYEVLTSIGERVKRIYRRGNEIC